MADAKTFRGSRSQTFSISRDEIERADDFGEIFDIAETLGVDLTGLDEINDMKTRLLLYYKKCEGEPNYKDVVSTVYIKVYLVRLFLGTRVLLVYPFLKQQILILLTIFQIAITFKGFPCQYLRII